MVNPSGFSNAFDFTGRTVLVTGANGGLGRVIARGFAQAGASLLLHVHGSPAAADRLVKEIRALGNDASAIQADLSVEKQVEQLFSEAARISPRLDVLVNNAGRYRSTPFMEMSLEEWESLLADNLTSAMLCSRAASCRMLELGGGSIINVASVEGLQPLSGHSHYNAAKAGLIMLTRSTALELAKHNIRVNAVSPGLVWREGLERDWPEGLAAWNAACPMALPVEPEAVANACLFLASPLAQRITGANLPIDGGLACREAF